MPNRTSTDVVERELLIPFEDETIAATRYVPVEYEGSLPVLLMSIPYRKDDNITFGAYDPLVRYLAKHGYNVVVADLLGTGASSGFLERPLAFVEGEATALIEWLAAREWSTGEVGMFGKSYGGRACLNAAAERPDSLEAIVPITASYASYDDAKYQGGAVNFYKQIGDWAPLMLTLAALPPSRRDPDGRWVEVWEDHLDGLDREPPWLFQFLEHDHKDDYWEEIDPDIANIDVPVFAISGWRDYYPHAPLEWLPEIDAPTRLLMGPWRHTVPHRGREVTVDSRAQIRDWFDHFLKDRDTGVEDRSPIEFWTERDGGGEIGAGSWRATDVWPEANDTAVSVALALSPDGLVRSDAFTDGVVDAEYVFDQTVGIDSIDFLAPPTDTNADDARSLLFETEPLSDPVEWTGTGRAKLRVTPSVEDHLLAVRVVDVSPAGDASLMSYGRVRASQRESYTDPEPPVPGEEYTAEVPLKPKSHVFERGHRIRVSISAAYFPLMLAPRYQGSFTVTSEPAAKSLVEFPGRIHDGGVDFDDRIEQRRPDDEVVPVASEFLRVTRSDWRTAREHTDDEASLTAVTERTIELPHGATMSWEREVEASVRADAPLTSVARSETSAEIDYGTEVVRVETTSRAAHDTASIAVSVRFGDQVMYDENWRWTR